ncbi:MAG TPA: helix-turn-helix domain-containing protein, partial [Stellaceae bacterium]|nr:helix-turn-helix domain-containing protein [Stellaceae bacterium]
LRRKLEPDPQKPTMIKTVRGTGYIFTPQVEVS